MKDQLVDFEIAKLAKEAGFNWPTHEYYVYENKFKQYVESVGDNSEYWGDNYFYDWNSNGEPFKPFNKNCISRPTQSILQTWLRNEKQFFLQVILVEQFNPLAGWGYELTYVDIDNDLVNTDENEPFSSYEEALEEGLQKSLKILLSSNFKS